MADLNSQKLNRVEQIEEATAVANAITVFVEALRPLGQAALEIYNSFATGTKLTPMRDYLDLAPYTDSQVPEEFAIDRIKASMRDGTLIDENDESHLVYNEFTIFAKPNKFFGQYVADVTRQPYTPLLKKEFKQKVMSRWVQRGVPPEVANKCCTYQCSPFFYTMLANEQKIQQLLRQGNRLEQCARRLYTFATAYWNMRFDEDLDLEFNSFKNMYDCLLEPKLSADKIEQRAVILEELFLNLYLTTEMHPIYCYLVHVLDSDHLLRLMKQAPSIDISAKPYPVGKPSMALVVRKLGEVETVLLNVDIGPAYIIVTDQNLYEVVKAEDTYRLFYSRTTPGVKALAGMVTNQ